MSRILTSGTKLPSGPVEVLTQVQRAELHRLDHLALAAERAVGELLALVAALGVLLDLGAEDAGADPVVGVLGDGIAELQDGLGLGRSPEAEGRGKHGADCRGSSAGRASR